jgi:hypothetical protein
MHRKWLNKERWKRRENKRSNLRLRDLRSTEKSSLNRIDRRRKTLKSRKSSLMSMSAGLARRHSRRRDN